MQERPSRQHAASARPLAAILAAVAIALSTSSAAQTTPVVAPPAGGDPAAPIAFLSLLAGDLQATQAAIILINETWDASYVPMALEILYLSRNPDIGRVLATTLADQTGEEHGYDIAAWQRWMWNQDYAPHPGYAEFKSRLYRLIDPKFGGYFSNDREHTIRLDEVVWGGVHQDGIPPLRGPKMIPAVEADYLADDNIVLGISINGDHRAYPNRILAWHEMFVDKVGGVPVAGVYCTLCGTVVLYRTVHAGTSHSLGTSGFLYRSNKLMYDQKTQSLWSTMRGSPVIGPLVGRGIELERGHVVTTTWGEWRRRHPDTTVLSVDTGYRRDYSEGAAYRDYFSTDELMFGVPTLDARLKNKAEVLALVFGDAPPLAISAEYLAANPVHHDAVGNVELVVLTDESGANRVYDARGIRFDSWDRDARATDADGGTWRVTEDALEAADGRTLARLPAHRAFWFGWFAAYPGTRLVR